MSCSKFQQSRPTTISLLQDITYSNSRHHHHVQIYLISFLMRAVSVFVKDQLVWHACDRGGRIFEHMKNFLCNHGKKTAQALPKCGSTLPMLYSKDQKSPNEREPQSKMHRSSKLPLLWSFTTVMGSHPSITPVWADRNWNVCVTSTGIEVVYYVNSKLCWVSNAFLQQ